MLFYAQFLRKFTLEKETPTNTYHNIIYKFFGFFFNERQHDPSIREYTAQA